MASAEKTAQTKAGPGNKPGPHNKPGPPKQFPCRVDLRVSRAELDALGRIAEAAGVDRSTIIRRFIHEADPGE